MRRREFDASRQSSHSSSAARPASNAGQLRVATRRLSLPASYLLKQFDNARLLAQNKGRFFVFTAGIAPRNNCLRFLHVSLIKSQRMAMKPTPSKAPDMLVSVSSEASSPSSSARLAQAARIVVTVSCTAVAVKMHGAY